MGGRLISEALHANPATGEDESITVYVAPTKSQAKRLMWGRLQIITEALGMPVEYNNSDLIGRHQNGAQVWIMGADDNRDVARLRGFAYRRVIIDEAQAVGADFDELIDDVLDPALADYEGDLILTGTPNAACLGYYYEASTGQMPGWYTSTWTVLDNPMFPIWRRAGKGWRKKAERWLDDYRQKKQWEEDNPTFQREWLGKWVRDIGGLVYRYDETRNSFDGTLPDGYAWRYVVGCDLGFNDAFSTVVLAFSEDLPTVYCVDQYERPGMIPSQWAAHLQGLCAKYHPEKILVDTGGMGKAVMEEFRQRYGLPAHPAEKKSKLDFIAHKNSDMVAGLIKYVPGTPITRSMQLLQWDEDRKKEDQRFHLHTHLTDADLYAWREAKHWLYEEPDLIPPAGTPERANHDMDQYWQRVMQDNERGRKGEWWEQ